MSKEVKQLQMDALKDRFSEVRDMVVLSISKLSSEDEVAFRAILRKKSIRLHGVKNSLARLAFKDMGLDIPKDSPYWQGPTQLAYGDVSIAEISRGIDEEVKDKKKAAKYKEAVKIKGAIADRQLVSFDVALKMPTREEAIARVIGMALAPAARIAGQLLGAGGRIAGQIKAISEGGSGDAGGEG